MDKYKKEMLKISLSIRTKRLCNNSSSETVEARNTTAFKIKPE